MNIRIKRMAMLKMVIKKIKKALDEGVLIERTKQKIRNNQIIFTGLDYDIENVYFQKKIYKKLYSTYKDDIFAYKKTNEFQDVNKIIWTCWLQGVDNAPEIVQACINSVSQSFYDYDYSMKVITKDNFSQYITLPKYIIEKLEKGIITNTHFSDILRIELLYKYGGIWIDSTVFVSDNCDDMKHILNDDIFIYKQISLDNRAFSPIICSSWLIKSKSNNEVIGLTRYLLRMYWKENNYLCHYFLLHFFLTMAFRKYSDTYKHIPTFNNQSPHILSLELENEFSEKRWIEIQKMSSFHKLSRHINYSDGNNFYNNILKGNI